MRKNTPTKHVEIEPGYAFFHSVILHKVTLSCYKIRVLPEIYETNSKIIYIV